MLNRNAYKQYASRSRSQEILGGKDKMSLTKIIAGAVVATSIGAATFSTQTKKTERVEIQQETKIEYINFEEPLVITGNLEKYNPKVLEVNNVYVENSPATEYVFDELHIDVNPYTN